MPSWDELVDATLATLAGKNLLFMQRLITLAPPPPPSKTFAGPGPWDRPTVEIRLDGASTQEWLALNGLVSEEGDEVDRKVVLFSGNDYIGLATHPAVLEAAAKAVQEQGMHGAEKLLLDLWLHYLPQAGGGITRGSAENGGPAAQWQRKLLSQTACSAWTGISLRCLNLSNCAANMDSCWSSMMHMEHFFAARTVVAYLRCLGVKMALTYVLAP